MDSDASFPWKLFKHRVFVVVFVSLLERMGEFLDRELWVFRLKDNSSAV